MSRMQARALSATMIASLVVSIGGFSASASTVQSGVSSDSAFMAAIAISDKDLAPVANESGDVVGYAVDESTRQALDELAVEFQGVSGIESQTPSYYDYNGYSKRLVTVDGWRIAKCVGAISAFIGLTVFPTAKAAKLAVRIGSLVRQHGVKKVAQILTRTYRGSDVNAQKIFMEIAKEAAGIGALEICFKG